MQITTEELEDYKLRVKYIADSTVIKEKNQKALEQLRNAKISGFRPGKATDQAIKIKFKDRIEQWVKAEMTNHANDDIVFQTKIRPIGRPEIEKVNLTNNSFELEAIYNKKPEFVLAEYKGIEIPAPQMDKSIEDIVQEYIQTLREKHGEVRPYEDSDFVQAKDRITLEYELSNGTKEEGKVYQVGSGLLDGFDENLYGMKAGDVREFDLSIDGQKVGCKATVHMGLKTVPCPLDDTLATKCGVENMDVVNDSVKQIAENHFKGERNAKIADQIRLRLLATNEFVLPNWLVNKEAEYMAQHQGVKYSELNDEAKENIRKQAYDSVKFTLIMDSIRRAEPETELSDAEALEAVKQTLVQRGVQDPDSFLQRSAREGSLMGFVERIRTDFAVQWLINNCKVVE